MRDPLTIRIRDDAAAFALLRELGTERMPHGHGRTLFAHLVGLARIVTAWGAPTRVRRAALFHSVYGTSVYRGVAAGERRRALVRATIGGEAERLAFAFGAVDRPRFSAAVAAMAETPSACVMPTRHGERASYAADDVVDLAVLGVANEFEQTRADDGSPAPWRVWCRPLCAALARWRPDGLSATVLDALAVPDGAEEDVVATYASAIDALARDDVGAAVAAFERVAASRAAVTESYAWLAEIAMQNGDRERAVVLAGRARERLLSWGGSSDHRLSFDAWLSVVESLERIDTSIRETSLLVRIAPREG